VTSEEPRPDKRPEPSDDDLAAEVQAYIDDAMAQFQLAQVEDPQLVDVAREQFESLYKPDPDDPRSREEPPPSSRLQATFKWEDQAEDGEDIGPLIVYDPDAQDVVWETPDWVRVSEAKALASSKKWQFAVDGSSDC
jgi:hypothetical protein